jgi:hypothetical protein
MLFQSGCSRFWREVELQTERRWLTRAALRFQRIAIADRDFGATGECRATRDRRCAKRENYSARRNSAPSAATTCDPKNGTDLAMADRQLHDDWFNAIRRASKAKRNRSAVVNILGD